MKAHKLPYLNNLRVLNLHLGRVFQELQVRLGQWGGHQGFWESGENGYLFLVSWRVLLIIFRDLWSKLMVVYESHDGATSPKSAVPEIYISFSEAHRGVIPYLFSISSANSMINNCQLV